MVKYIKVNDFEISEKFYDFLKYHKYMLCTVSNNFIAYLIEPNMGNRDFSKVFAKIHKIHCLDNGYLLINDKQEVKVGRILTKIGKIIHGRNKCYNMSHDIEFFVDSYKAWDNMNKLEFKYLKGEEIRKGYFGENYTRNDFGSLHTSCMNNKPSLLDLYTLNPDKVSLLVLVDNEGKIYGRALVWKLRNSNHLYMDRVYVANNYIHKIFNEYATKNKMIHRSKDHDYTFVIYKPSGKSTTSKRFKMSVKVKTKGITKFPYMDSLNLLDTWSNTLSNIPNRFSKNFDLQSTDGYKSSNGIRLFGLKII